MSSWIEPIYFFLGGGALLLCALGLWFTAIMPGIDRWSKRFFLSYFIVLIVYGLFCFIDTLLLYCRAATVAIYIILFLETLLLSLTFLMLTAYLVHCRGERLRRSRIFRATLVSWAVYGILLVIFLVIGGFVYISPDGQYYRGPMYPLVVLPMLVILTVDLVCAIRWRKRLSRKVFLSFIIAIMPMMAMLFVNMFIDFFALIDIGAVVSSVAMYGLIQSDQMEKDLRHEREIAKQQLEIANQRASIMVLQMRPHFIYNTMTSIYCLCNQDPPLARQVILDFTTYLRKNFTAIASTAPIPFTSELEHTRAYLAVEQAQYEDALFVEYDTPHTLFRVPPLTLQPIVENAVKHGRDPYAGPFHISIRTRKTDAGSEIIVADDGRGFDPAADNEPHIALKNIQQRLEIMCGGKLTIEPGDGGGTVVTVTIPG